MVLTRGQIKVIPVCVYSGCLHENGLGIQTTRVEWKLNMLKVQPMPSLIPEMNFLTTSILYRTLKLIIP